MSLENPVVLSVQSSPTLSGISYHTPSRGTSRQSSRQRSSSQYTSSSPPPLPHDDDSYSQRLDHRDDVSNDESISALDPRRFTPNLHASLVSEILSLRREIESKNVILGGLEDNVHETKLENTQLSQALKGQVAEVRSIKKQMHLLESGTLSTLGEMAKERDDAVESLSEIRKRLDSSKNKLRVQEEEAERTHGLWDRDRQVWDVEKRNMDRKIYVVEGRLRTILAEVAAAQASGSHLTSTSNDVDEGMRETWFTKSSDTTSNRSSSVKGRSRFSGMSNNTQDGGDAPNFRSSTLSGLNVYGGTRLNGLSLAEELEFDEEEKEDRVDESDQEGENASPGALPEEAQMRSQRPSAQMQSQDDKARKVLGLLTESNERLVQEAVAGEQQIARLDEKTDYMVENVPPRYQDNATQFSPPQSPKRRVQNSVGSMERNPEQTEHIANQRRKRVSLISPSAEQTFPTKTGQSGPLPMVSASCQTTEPLSPPMTPVNPANSPSSPRHGDFLMMESTSTQTDDEDVLMKVLSGADDGPFMTVPVIEIHPPSSRPPSSHNSVVLPPRTKNAGCQASINLPTLLRSISVQTEDTCLTQKSDRLPSKPSLSHGTTKPTSRHTEAKEPSRKQTSPRKSSRRNVQLQLQGERKPARAKATAAEPTDSYPGNNDDGPLNMDQTSGIKRPVRVDSLFAGCDISNDPAPQLPEIDFSDDDFDNAAPIRKTLSKVQNSWKLVPHSNNIDLNELEPNHEERPDKETTVKMDTPHRESMRDKVQTPTDIPAKSSNNPPTVPVVPKGSDIRRTVLILNGTSAHKIQGAGSTTQSKESLTIPPPFSVPTRSSSRKLPISASEGAQSPTPYSSTFLPGSRSQALGRPPSKNAILRKVRSATAVPKVSHPNHRRSRSRSPLRPTLTATAESPRHPRLPDYNLTPRKPRQQHRQSIPSTSSLISPVIEAPLHTLEHPTSVVDAIAQTMVGEWMWKYVRRRKSFGLSESPQIEFDIGRNGGEASSGSGIRHKRWVWLAPYERAIMWNSKQPTSGPALLGKSGRKLIIQSVLDVKDDTPMPKNSDPQSVFNRSILILTPQRALKFTAPNQERHQLWLTALSFLSHSSSGTDELPSIPAIPQEYQRPPSQGSAGTFRRGGIRDSIRVAKSKGRPRLDGMRAFTTPLGIPHPQAHPTSYDDDPTDAAEPPFVPRVSAHTHNRKRSSTGPRPGPPNASQNFSVHTSIASNYSLKATLSQDSYSAFPSASGQNLASHSNGDAYGSSLPAVRNNFFDAVGTVRMEAFIDHGENGHGQSSQVPQKKDSKDHRMKQGGKKDLSYWGLGGPIGDDLSMARGNESRWRGDDPFKGF